MNFLIYEENLIFFFISVGTVCTCKKMVQLYIGRCRRKYDYLLLTLLFIHVELGGGVGGGAGGCTSGGKGGKITENKTE